MEKENQFSPQHNSHTHIQNQKRKEKKSQTIKENSEIQAGIGWLCPLEC